MREMVSDYLSGEIESGVVYSTIYTFYHLNFKFYDNEGVEREVSNHFQIDMCQFTVSFYVFDENGKYIVWGDEAKSVTLPLGSLVIESKSGALVAGFGVEFNKRKTIDAEG